MAKLPAHPTRVWVDEFAIAGFINATEMELDQENPVVTCFADTGPRRVVGNHDHKGQSMGFFDGAAGAFDQLAHVDLRTDEAHYKAQAFGAAAEGDPIIERVMRIKGQPRSAKSGDAVLTNISDEGAGAICRATILRSAAITGTGDGTGRNLGATTSGQVLQVVHRVLSVSGAGSITLQIHESQNDGSPDAYANIAALAATFTAIGVARLTTTAATEAWKRLTVSAFSGFTSVTILTTIGVVPTIQ